MPYRILITTHHITSRAKILSLTRAAGAHNISVLIKMTSKPPGVMICEGGGEAEARKWLAAVQSLRYLGYRCVKTEDVPGSRLVNGGKVGVKVLHGTKEFLAEIQRADGEEQGGTSSSLMAWWREAIGFTKS